MLSNYYDVADLVKGKSSDIISYRFDQNDYNPFRLGEVNYLLNHPLHVPEVSRELMNQLKKYFNTTEEFLVKLPFFQMEILKNHFFLYQLKIIKEYK